MFRQTIYSRMGTQVVRNEDGTKTIVCKGGTFAADVSRPNEPQYLIEGTKPNTIHISGGSSNEETTLSVSSGAVVDLTPYTNGTYKMSLIDCDYKLKIAH